MSTVIENEAFWKQELEKLKTSGLSRSKYCRVNGINYDRFGYWAKRLTGTSSTFVPVKVQAQEMAIPSPVTLCTIELSGHVLKIYDFSALSFVLERLA